MEQLVSRIRQIHRLHGLSDALLLHLLSNSDYLPDRVANGVILFQQGETITYWYLLLSGEVELYLPSDQTIGFGGEHIETLPAGVLFGELSFQHSCSARLRRSSEFVRISQPHFLTLYNKHADHLQPFIVVMSDLVNDRPAQNAESTVPTSSRKSLSTIKEERTTGETPPNQNQTSQPTNTSTVPSKPPLKMNGCLPNEAPFEFATLRRELPEMPSTSQAPYRKTRSSNERLSSQILPLNGKITSPRYEKSEDPAISDWKPPVNLFELSNTLSIDSRIYEAGLVLKRAMQIRAPSLIRERLAQRGDQVEVFPDSMSGAEMTAWLHDLSIDCLVSTTKPYAGVQLTLTGIWQTLLDHHIISHVTNEQQFRDKAMFYKWTIDDPFNDYYEYRATHPNTQFMSDALLEHVENAPIGGEVPTLSDIHDAIFFLSTVAPDSLFRIVLAKPPNDRTVEELELVYEELLHVKALSHLSTMVKRELASVVRFEQHQHAGTVLFHQGDEGKSWYVILRGSVDVSVAGKGIVTTLLEGDDFGKLALVNDAPRAATIALREDNSQFLRVDKSDFNRILRDVEANTVRLKEHGQDVLVLEQIDVRFQDGQVTPRNQCCYSVMAGLPEKMVEYVLETRIDAQTDELSLDTFLEDFILTHIIYMPSNVLCNYLKNYYEKRGNMSLPSTSECTSRFVGSDFNLQEQLVAKRRVIAFLGVWQYILGLGFFLDHVANSFVEEMYCLVFEDSKVIPNMGQIQEQITKMRQIREKSMRILARHPIDVLDAGVYNPEGSAPNPILPIDTCKQLIYFSDTSFIALSIRLDKTAMEIAKLACAQAHIDNNAECFLIEVKSSGERVVYSPTEVSVPTMLSLNGRLYVVFKEEIDLLTPLPEQNGPSEPFFNSILDVMSSSELAQQLFCFHTQLFEATDEIELVFQVIGRNQFPGRSPSNLDVLLRRFNEVQFWVTTEILLAPNASKRVAVMKKFIKIAMYAKTNKDLMTLFAVTLGLSNVSISRLAHTWEKLPNKLRRQYAEFEALLDPSRNHRAYRMLVSKMQPPIVPFVPLLLKDLTFMHEGNKTYFSGLVNFEKMHMIANVLRTFRNCKTKHTQQKKVYSPQNIIKNFYAIDDQRRLMEISYQIEPPTKFSRQY
ncbi:Rap guanine nucleotide exchange factor 1 [Aphelenchoides besseyi]|nr:Rap guanine nucleotide exchange factor 1 [Aphelenchoides besseyi]